MNLNTKIEQYITQESIVDMLTKYELYYQISLGNYLFETLQDVEETTKKLDELNLKVELNVALSNIFEIIYHLIDQDNFEDIFEYHLRSRALMHSLKDFVNNDKDLVSVDNYIKQKSNDILDDKYFTENMRLQFESEYGALYDYYDMLITEDIVNQIFHKENKDEREE